LDFSRLPPSGFPDLEGNSYYGPVAIRLYWPAFVIVMLLRSPVRGIKESARTNNSWWRKYRHFLAL